MSEALEPEKKKLRSSEPDLVVVVGDDQKEYHYHSPVMATHSKYIDAMLATSMRESRNRRINFPDLSAEVWESMIYFLNPATSRQMTVEGAMQVAAAYDKYDFRAGVECCDQVLVELFDTVGPCVDYEYEPEEKPEDLNQLIDAFLLADVANLEQTKYYAAQYFEGALDWALNDGQIIFNETQIKKLAPLIAKENLLEETSFTNDEILHSLFPKFFVNSCIIRKTNQIVDRAVIGLSLSGTSFFDGDIKFTAKSTCRRFISRHHKTKNGDPGSLRIERLTDNWVIYERPVSANEPIENNILWENPLSENMPLPPKSGWVSVSADRRARGRPKIEYLYRK